MNLLGNVTFSHRPLPGTPRIIANHTLNRMTEDSPLLNQLSAPDVMITVLYNINQKALLALVNPEVKNFIFKLVMSRNSGASYYLIRNGNDISVSNPLAV